LTDSKRTAQASDARASGSSKSLRYQPIDPFIDSTESSPTFHAFGTLTGAQPARLALRWKPWRSPWPAASRRKSHSPSMR
jgi:hypothetical protein